MWPRSCTITTRVARLSVSRTPAPLLHAGLLQARALLAQAEPPAEAEPATVLGDVRAATTLLAWFDRVQGLKPRV